MLITQTYLWDTPQFTFQEPNVSEVATAGVPTAAEPVELRNESDLDVGTEVKLIPLNFPYCDIWNYRSYIRAIVWGIGVEHVESSIIFNNYILSKLLVPDLQRCMQLDRNVKIKLFVCVCLLFSIWLLEQKLMLSAHPCCLMSFISLRLGNYSKQICWG